MALIGFRNGQRRLRRAMRLACGLRHRRQRRRARLENLRKLEKDLAEEALEILAHEVDRPHGRLEQPLFVQLSDRSSAGLDIKVAGKVHSYVINELFSMNKEKAWPRISIDQSTCDGAEKYLSSRTSTPATASISTSLTAFGNLPTALRSIQNKDPKIRKQV